MGLNNRSSGGCSTGFGDAYIASGNFSASIGQTNTASGVNSMALLYNNSASGDFSLAAGYSNTAGGQNSIAIGTFNQTATTGEEAFSIGRENQSNNLFSYTFGNYLTSNAENAMVIGHGLYSSPHTLIAYLNNSTAHSLVVGFNTDKASLFVGPGDGQVSGKIRKCWSKYDYSQCKA